VYFIVSDINVPLWLLLAWGILVGFVFSTAGAAGGILLVPLMSIVMRLPMHVIAGTSTLAIAIHSVTSIANYARLGLRSVTRCRVSC